VSDDFFNELNDLTPGNAPVNLDAPGGVETGLSKLASLVEDLNRELTTKTVLDRVMDAAIELTGAERGFLVLAAESGEWTFESARNMAAGNIEDAQSAASHTVIRKVLEGRQPILINDVVGASDLTKQQSIAKMQVRSIMGAPLISKGKLLGAAYVDTSRLAGVFDETSLVLFQTFVQLAAVALENARLIEAEKQAAARYRDVQEYLDTVLRSQPHGVIILDKTLTVEYANPQATKLLNGTAFPRGVKFSEAKCCSAEAILRILSGLQHYLETGESTRQTLQVGADSLAFSYFDVHGQADGMERIGLIVENITTQKQLEAKLVESEKRSTVNQLAGGIAHEINNSLMPVKGRVELLRMRLEREGMVSTESLGKDLDTITQLSTRIEKIVKNLRNLTRPAKPEFEPLDLRQLLLLTVDMMESTTGKLKHFSTSGAAPFQLHVDLDTSLPLIMGERHGLESALINMMINACHAIQDKSEGTLTISAHRVEEGIEVAISDTGTGIPDDVLPHVFEPYFTTKGDEGGTGLGMSIIQNIAEVHNARLEVQSKWGEGTTVKLTFPVMNIAFVEP
jgi:two-component system NtrC family sensor kinase